MPDDLCLQCSVESFLLRTCFAWVCKLRSLWLIVSTLSLHSLLPHPCCPSPLSLSPPPHSFSLFPPLLSLSIYSCFLLLITQSLFSHDYPSLVCFCSALSISRSISLALSIHIYISISFFFRFDTGFTFLTALLDGKEDLLQ